MARKPVAIQQQTVPFSEGAPADDLQVETIGDEVLIGDPELDKTVEPDSTFDENLAEDMSAKDLGRTASDLINYYNNDREARSEWEERYKKGLETLNPDGGMEDSEDERASRGLSIVVHPMIAEAATSLMQEP